MLQSQDVQSAGMVSNYPGISYYPSTDMSAHPQAQSQQYPEMDYPQVPVIAYDAQRAYASQAGYVASDGGIDARHHRSYSSTSTSYSDPSSSYFHAGAMQQTSERGYSRQMDPDLNLYSQHSPSGTVPSSMSSAAASRFVPTPAETLQSYGSKAASAVHANRSGTYTASSRNTHSQSPMTIQIPEHTPGAAQLSAPRYQCDRCDTTFSRAHDRTRHIQTHHCPENQTRNKCQDCGRSFSRSDALKRHRDSGCRGPSPQ
ncbi:hypothetical protein NEOLEDRAFT_1175465 [Neolentinus lepideus HHB14362 ss-1]|uniref:C2H2-type domain-containing protein n=1 Tax=Neolentinus lepideus HHB14362 ss-1 TaxID=1314782 RepID=A0A165V4X6_9AGAM|nr:hypothetical protein NEOLEDRAFT_1175465 [Neolentinus lepideus HHB14362 ss-1]